jgi:dipeptidyl aminopeptidase/acylaminoacyl peptidase
MLERSPIFYAGQAETPLLIMHGKDDPRVDAGQSYELYRHYKLRSEAPVRLVLFPGEGHGNRNATARFDYSLRALQWFDRFLMDGAEDAPSADLDYESAVPEGAMEMMGTH